MTEYGGTGVDELGPDFLRMAGAALLAAGGDHEAATRLLVRRVALGRSADAAAAVHLEQALVAAARRVGWERHPTKPGLWRRRREAQGGG